MEAMTHVLAYGWTAYCAVSHINHEARKRGEVCTWKQQRIAYLVMVPCYWFFTFLILCSG